MIGFRRCSCCYNRRKKEEEKSKSNLYLKGTINPEEFIQACDYLKTTFPCFKWNESKSEHNFNMLPKNKQYLSITIASNERLKDYVSKSETIEKEINEDWIDVSQGNETIGKKLLLLNDKIGDDEDDFIIELDDDYIIGDEILFYLVLRKKMKKKDYKNEIEKKYNNMKNSDKALYKLCCLPDNNFYGILKYIYKKKTLDIRMYNVYITYDQYYMVPRIWFMGYNNKGIPLTKEEMDEDIVPIYKNRALTYEINDMIGNICYSIHPCRHSQLILRLIDKLKKNNENYGIENIILLFLKNIQEIIPTIKFV